MDIENNISAEEQLSRLFGGYRAEWLKEKIFDLFTAPAYLPELSDNRPCMLIGGRGTGKTTVLRGLSYEGQFALTGSDASSISTWSYYGLYYRVNTNRVTAFRGSELTENQWIQLFAHYFNLLLCDALLQFLEWYQLKTGTTLSLPAHASKEITTSLHLPDAASFKEITEKLSISRIAFEASINNVADRQIPPLTMQGAPIDTLLRVITSHPPFVGKSFYFLIDEYENFEPYQQQVVNTLIKHSGQLYTFKIGVRDLGIRRKATLNPNEQLISPSDYVRIDISDKLKDKQFEDFALKVCNDRIRRLNIPDAQIISDIRDLLPSLSEDAEAIELGVEELVSSPKAQLFALFPEHAKAIGSLHPLFIYFLSEWAVANKSDLQSAFSDYLSSQDKWATRFGNYKHSALFGIRKGKRGIQRYYAGWDVFIQMAASNIRYLLELVDQSLLNHLQRQGKLNQPVSHKDQTYAAQRVGKKNLSELEGLSVHGAQLTKLLLSLGRVFGQLASDPIGHAPEVNQFHLAEASEERNQITQTESAVVGILESAVMHLALLRWPGNKLGAEGDTRDYDYTIHPVFSAFFVFSYRKKRKMLLSPDDILGLVNSPQRTIPEILKRHNRTEEPLPEQLEIFKGFYEHS